ncbi:MAG: hypothetical protein U5K74_13440 [Gemmatimonadaceae bacterium]|nr:hypothetical protein [Gemmatimonadaceae bacterium]
MSCGGEQLLADHLADARGEARLVLRDRTLHAEKRLVRVEEHPDRHGVRQATGEAVQNDVERKLAPEM